MCAAGGLGWTGAAVLHDRLDGQPMQQLARVMAQDGRHGMRPSISPQGGGRCIPKVSWRDTEKGVAKQRPR